MGLKQIISLLTVMAALAGILLIPAYGSEQENTGVAQIPVKGTSVCLSDIDGHWAEESIRQAMQEGWVNGYPDGTFRPNGTITRAEFIKMILAATKVTPGCDVVNHMKQCHRYEAPKFIDMNESWLTKQG